MMANTIPLRDWLKVIDTEYLSSFIRDGGASIKFAVTGGDLKRSLYEAMQSRCVASDYLFFTLDATAIRVHMPQDIFFGVAKQVDWRLLARRLILGLAEENGYLIDNIDPKDTANVFEAISEANSHELQFVLRELKHGIQDRVAKEYRMAKDFRVAMSQLCLFENTRRNQPYKGQPLVDWLTGSVTRISSVKQFEVHSRINRTTARHCIESALYWFRHTGYSGTVILLDNSRVTVARNPRDGLRYYTKAATMDHYECLREFIDGTDQLTGALIVVVTNNEFLDESGSRGYDMYRALKTRVMNDVRDKNLVNPVASLVQLS
jgi:hypothetical protein